MEEKDIFKKLSWYDRKIFFPVLKFFLTNDMFLGKNKIVNNMGIILAAFWTVFFNIVSLLFIFSITMILIYKTYEKTI